jgi:hypothetical protein
MDHCDEYDFALKQPRRNANADSVPVMMRHYGAVRTVRSSGPRGMAKIKQLRQSDRLSWLQHAPLGEPRASVKLLILLNGSVTIRTGPLR